MHETAEDLATLQELLDRSYASAGEHLKRIITPERRLTAAEVSERLTGMSLLSLATVTGDCRPLVGPVDGVFFRGAFYFGSAPDSMRMRHVRARPQVSATHVPEEALAVTVHGRAELVDVQDPEQLEFRRTLLEVYVPLYGESWEQFLDSGPVYARIDAERMYTFYMENIPHV
jgi:nitroimidazol reductase NimA-like FMN-containing flavoprotein (pyridoxamine 5'-phosphate oxidase superfamily)